MLQSIPQIYVIVVEVQILKVSFILSSDIPGIWTIGKYWLNDQRAHIKTSFFFKPRDGQGEKQTSFKSHYKIHA